MAKTQIKLISSNEQARVTTFQVVRGDEYEALNYSQAVVTMDNPFGDKKEDSAVFVNTFDPEHPNHWVIPTALEIGSGKVFSLDSYKLNNTVYDQGYKSFRTGVIDVNFYGGMQIVSVVGNEGDTWFTGTGLSAYLEKYDSVLINNKPYQLRKDRNTNGGTVLYVTEPLTEDITEVTFAERANLKLYNDFLTKYIVAKVAHIMVGDRPEYNSQERERAVLKVIRNNIASDIFFHQGDYDKVERLTKESIQIGNWLGILRRESLWD